MNGGSAKAAAPRRVLPTLNEDGTRRRLRPRAFRGRYYWRRLWVAWALIGLFAGLPFARFEGRPLVLLDVASREFTLFGRVFLATDGALLMLLMLTIFVGVFLLTAVLGRAWCGWGCPQTVYLEFLFRPLGRWLEGGRAAQLRLDKNGANWRRVLKYGVYLGLSLGLANIFLAYFVGTERLGVWMTSSPLEQPTGFAVLSVTTALVFADFAYFREQMCTVVCPYARLQSVLLDPRSLVVGYDRGRGEPRGRGQGAGDCVDCGACVVTCPTGIDIRDGMQMECIACTQCVDACDSVMHKFGREPGLVRYDEAHRLQAMAGSQRPVRPRLLLYPALLVVLLGAMFVIGSQSARSDITLLRGLGAPFSVQGQFVHNQIRVKIQNRSRSDALFSLALASPEQAVLVAPDNPVTIEGGERATLSAFIQAPRQLFVDGQLSVQIVVTEDSQPGRTLTYKMLGPRSSEQNAE